jgi:hypothetical protein
MTRSMNVTPNPNDMQIDCWLCSWYMHITSCGNRLELGKKPLNWIRMFISCWVRNNYVNEWTLTIHSSKKPTGGIVVLACWMVWYQRFACIGVLNGMVPAVCLYWRAEWCTSGLVVLACWMVWYERFGFIGVLSDMVPAVWLYWRAEWCGTSGLVVWVRWMMCGRRLL